MSRLTFAVRRTEDLRDAAWCSRRLLRCGGRAALGTSLQGAPYVSLVLYAVDLDASPLLLISGLAQHSRNIAADPRVSLLIDGTAQLPEPLSGPRLTLLGRAEEIVDPRLLRRFTARHPEATDYAGFADFRLYRVAVERGHFVAGFGRIAWIDAAELLLSRDGGALAAAEPTIVADINENMREIFARCLSLRLGFTGEDWLATGCDPEGLDVRCDGAVARLDFVAPVSAADAVPAALAQLAGPAGE
jgi:heme iron utilization protein